MATPSVGREGAVIVGDIEGGEAPERIDMDDNIRADHIYDTIRRYPSYKGIVSLDVEAVWSNWLNEESIELDRLIECKDGMEDAVHYGWAIIIVDATSKPPRCERWHPKIDGTGCEITKTTPMGAPLQVQIQARFNESSAPLNYKVDHYPCEVREIKIGEEDDGTPILSKEYIRDKPLPGGRGFFLIRTRGGKKGIRGLPRYLDLIMIIRKAYDIIENYATYAEQQALGIWGVGLERNTKPNRDSVKNQFTAQPSHKKLIIVGKEDWIDKISAMNAAWDPWGMLEYLDKLIARDTQMNKLMLEGDPTGALAASDTAVGRWDARTKERQAYWLGQFKPIFMALGASKNVQFQDPSKPTFISLMEGLKAAREALYGIVMTEDIVDLYNEFLTKHGQSQKLRPISDEEQNKIMGGMDNGNSGQPGADNKGSETSKEE